MNVTKLAAAIAVVSITASAQAYDLKISGDFNVGYFSSSEKVEESGSELNFDLTTKPVRGIKFMAHTELDVNGITTDEGEEPYFDEIRAGMKGHFGEVWFGDQSNACDKLQKGGDFHKFLAANTNGCKNEPHGTFLYMKSIGNAKVGVSHNPEHDESAVGIQYKVNKKTTVAAGYVKSDGESYISVSGSADIGPATLKTRIKNDGAKDDTVWSFHGGYKFGDSQLYGSLDSEKTKALGYKYSFGKPSLRLEARDKNGADVEYAVGISTEW